MAARKEQKFREHMYAEVQSWDAGDGIPLEEDLAGLEADLGVKLPQEYRRFQLRHGAVMVAASDDVWPDGKPGKSGPYWTFLKGFMILGLGRDCPDYMDIRTVTEGFHEEFPETSNLIPFFAYSDDADFFCFDKNGHIHIWSHEQPGQSEVQGIGFDQFVINETKKLVLRKDAVKEAVARYGKKWREKAKSPELP